MLLLAFVASLTAVEDGPVGDIPHRRLGTAASGACKDAIGDCKEFQILCGADAWVYSNCAKTCGKCPSGVKQGTNDEAAIKTKAEDEAAAKKKKKVEDEATRQKPAAPKKVASPTKVQTTKAAKAKATAPATDSKAAVTVCAKAEGKTCSCAGTVLYGRKFVGGKPGTGVTTSLAQLKTTGYKEKHVSGSIQCSSGAMGGDPLSGYYKYCMCVPAQKTTPTTPTPKKANEQRRTTLARYAAATAVKAMSAAEDAQSKLVLRIKGQKEKAAPKETAAAKKKKKKKAQTSPLKKVKVGMQHKQAGSGTKSRDSTPSSPTVKKPRDESQTSPGGKKDKAKCSKLGIKHLRCPRGFRPLRSHDAPVYVPGASTCVTIQYALCQCKQLSSSGCPAAACQLPSTAKFRGLHCWRNSRNAKICQISGKFKRFDTVRTVAFTAPFKATAHSQPNNDVAANAIQVAVNKVYTKYLEARSAFVSKCREIPKADGERKGKVSRRAEGGKKSSPLKPCELPYVTSCNAAVTEGSNSASCNSNKNKWEHMTIAGSEDWPDTSTRCSNANPLVNDWFGYQGAELAWNSFDPRLVKRARLKPATRGAKPDIERQYFSSKRGQQKLNNLKSRFQVGAFGDKNESRNRRQMVRTLRKWLPGGDIQVIKGKVALFGGALLYAELGGCAVMYTLFITMLRGQPMSRTTEGSGTITEPLLGATLNVFTPRDLQSHATYWLRAGWQGKAGQEFWKIVTARRKAHTRTTSRARRSKLGEGRDQYAKFKTNDPVTCNKIDGLLRQGIAEFRLWLAEHSSRSKLGEGIWSTHEQHGGAATMSCFAYSSTAKGAWNQCNHEELSHDTQDDESWFAPHPTSTWLKGAWVHVETSTPRRAV